MTGMDAATGRPVSGLAHLAQSIADILSTPIGTRVMRRDYGSALFELVDAPVNGLTRLRVFAATAVALARWEPRLQLTRVRMGGDAAQLFTGRARIELEGRLAGAASPTDIVRLSIPLRPITA